MKATDARHNRIATVKKYLPNVLTILRIVCSFILLLLPAMSTWFLFIYLLAGLSDMLDGYFARRFHTQSELGARLDSAADFLLCVVILVVLIPFYHWPLWVILWIFAIAVIRLVALLICYLRFRQFAFLHTNLNKATGLLLFLSPVFFWLFGLNATAIILCLVATISAMEELMIELRSDQLNPDCRSLLKCTGKV